jgi:hypothetical protein
MVALFLVVLTGFVAIVVDAGAGYTASRHDRDVADASALAAAYTIWAELKATPAATSLATATTASAAAAEQNSCDAEGDGEGTEETTFGSCVAATPVYLASDNATVTASAQTASYVKVVVTDASPNGFAQLSHGGHSITESVTSEAAVKNSSGGGGGTTLSCEVCVLGNVTFGSKDTDITASAGNIVIDGNVSSCCSASFVTANSPHTVDIQGTWAAPPQVCSNSAPYPPTTGTCVAATPLKTGAFVDPGLAAPVTTGLTVQAAWSGAGTINPGIYPSITSGGGGTTLTLNAGVYVITGAVGFVIAGGTIAATAGVTLYFACSSFPTPCTTGQLGAGFSLSSTGSTLNLTAPVSGPQTNMAMYFDPKNTATFSVSTTSFAGNISGAMYMPAGTINVSSKGSEIFGSPIVVKTISITSGGSLGQLTGSLTVGGSTPPPGGLFCLTTPPCRT